MHASTPFLVESHHPARFASRGVATPFTTPMLAGARLRNAPHTGVELVVPNPSGGRGVYILDWSGVRALCAPTVHDTVLFHRLAGIGPLDPASVRDTALAVARDGHAGQAAIAAAEAAVAADTAQCRRVHFRLTAGLIEQAEPSGLKPLPMAEHAADLDRRGSAVLHRIAPMLNRSPQDLANALEAMGGVFAPAGVTAEDQDARIARVLPRMHDTRLAVMDWLDVNEDSDIGGLGRAIAGALQTAAGYGAAILAATRAGCRDGIALLRRWFADGAAVTAAARRADWVLDGWDWVCLLWLSAKTDEARRVALLEMALLVPVLPRETLDWPDVPVPRAALEPPCRVTSRDDSWRSGGSAVALVERNEAVRAMSL